MDRGKIMLGNVQLLLTVFIALGVYKDTTIGIFIFSNSLITFPIITIVFLAILIGIGKFEYDYKIIESQQGIDNEHNPMLKEIHKMLKERIS
jgi:hypothetical protein